MLFSKERVGSLLNCNRQILYMSAALINSQVKLILKVIVLVNGPCKLPGSCRQSHHEWISALIKETSEI